MELARSSIREAGATSRPNGLSFFFPILVDVSNLTYGTILIHLFYFKWNSQPGRQKSIETSYVVGG